MEELIKILKETYKGLDASEEEIFSIAHKLIYQNQQNTERQNTELVIEDEELIEIEMSIGDFHKYNGIQEINYPVQLFNNYYVQTPSGLTRIKAGIKKSKHDIIEIEFEDGTIHRVAEKHLYPQYNGKDIFADEVQYVITKNGRLNVKSKKFYKNDYVYDIGVAEPHLYYTADGVLSHNSALLACVAGNMVVNKKNILYITLEMSEEETAKRIDANILNIDINKFKETPASTIEQAFNSIKDNLGTLIIKEYPAGSMNTLKLENLYNELKNENIEIDAIFIDYLGLMSSTRTSLEKAGGSYGYIKSISEECHALSKKLNLPIITASQLNRSAYDNVDAGLETVSDSIGLVQTADTFIFIINSDQMKENNQVLLKFGKNRNTGQLNSLMLEVDFAHMRYTDWDDDQVTAKDSIPDFNQDDSFSSVGTGLDVSSFNF